MKHPYLRSRLLGAFLSLAIIACDQWSKTLVIAYAHDSLLPMKLLPFFNIVLVFNTGVSFGMFAGSAPLVGLLLLIGLCFIVIILAVWLLKAQEKLVITALGFIIGGAIGNIIDRVRLRGVTDFLDFHVNAYHWPAFNIADSAIFIGVVLFVFTNIISENRDLKITMDRKE